MILNDLLNALNYPLWTNISSLKTKRGNIINSTEEEIIKYRTKICIKYSNTAWLRATNYELPLDNKYCGEKLWALWYNPNALSVYSLVREDTISSEILQKYVKLDEQLDIAFTESVKKERQIL